MNKRYLEGLLGGAVSGFLYKSSADLIEPSRVGVYFDDCALVKPKCLPRVHQSIAWALFTATLFVLTSPVVLADPYQDAIDKAFPGFRIMSPQDIKLYKDEMDNEVYNSVKDHPGLATGKFNADEVMDFAALIRGAEKKIDQMGNPYYDGYLVICYGAANGGFDCITMSQRPREYHLPFGWYVTKVSPGEQSCIVLKQLDTQQKQRTLADQKRQRNVTITTKSDAVGYFRTMGNGDIVYVFQERTLYSECLVSD